MILTDTHIHLYAQEFNTDRDLLISDAMAKGVQRFFLPNIDSTSMEAMLLLEKKYPENCFAMMGLHPCSVKENWQEELTLVEKHFAERKFTGVGEIGMDLFWDKTFVKEQEEVFRRQVRLGSHYKLPIIIHSRESFEEIYNILLSESRNSQSATRNSVRGIFHCFTGTIDQAWRALELGFYLGIGGVVTFKNSGLDNVVREIDLNHLVLETDAPYLAPAPFRGKRNVPEYILKVAEKVASLKAISVDDVAQITTENSKKIFGK